VIRPTVSRASAFVLAALFVPSLTACSMLTKPEEITIAAEPIREARPAQVPAVVNMANVPGASPGGRPPKAASGTG
jgi:hypothetical protein